MKKILVIVAVIIFVATIFITGLVFMAIIQIENNFEVVDTSKEYRIIETLEPGYKEELSINETVEPSQTPLVTPSTTPKITNFLVPTTPASKLSNENDNTAESFASIEISTIKHTRTYEIMPNVNENTLKKNIGWLPSSYLPNQEGLCILMGHRDTDLSILRYAEIGDKLTIEMNGFEFKYSVSVIEIVNSDSELRFEAHNGSMLVLVTCYPFRYSGHAPQKYVVYGKAE